MTIDSFSALREAIARPPFHRFLEVEVVGLDKEGGTVEIRIPFKEEFRRSPDRPEIHGGIIACLVDIAGNAVLTSAVGSGIPTINMHVDFLRVASETALTATARALRVGRSIGVVDVVVHDQGGNMIAAGRGTYGIRRATESNVQVPETPQ